MDLIQSADQDSKLLSFRKKHYIAKKATVLFARYGIQSVSMNDIANKCSISKKTIYAFWGSKELLLTEILELVLAENGKALDEIQAGSFYPELEIQKLFYILQKTIEVLTPCFFGDLREYYPNTYHLLQLFYDNKLSPFLIQNFKRGKNEGVYRSNLDNESLSLFYCWQVKSIYEATLLPFDGYKLLCEVNRLFLQGIIYNSTDVL